MTTGDVRDRAVRNVDARHGYTYEFSSSPEAHLAEYDAEEARLNEHVYYQRTKLVHSGQLRLYYAAGCSCGWQHKQFRVTDERAVTDWFQHAERATQDDDV